MTAAPLDPPSPRVTARPRDGDRVEGAGSTDRRADRLRTALPVTLALLLLAGVAGAALWALHGALAFGVWFLGAG